MTNAAIHNGFLPDAGRAVQVDNRMRAELGKSLLHISACLQKQVTDNSIRGQLPDLENFALGLGQEARISPAVFAFYYELVFSILDGQPAEEISQLIGKTIKALVPAEQFAIKDLSSRDFPDETLLNVYRKSLDNDPGEVYGFLPPAEDGSQQARASIKRAMSLMQQTVPAMHAEIQAIISEILLASAPKTKDAPKFDGASSYQLWGAVTLNADNEKSDIEMLETLAHECAHCLLFGLTVDEPLVRNDDNERYQSPLRDDPRPMDGIYHATFVAARMHYAMQEARRSPVLSTDQREECESYLAASRQAFHDGYAIVAKHARYSETGYEIMQNALAYMQEVSETPAIA